MASASRVKGASIRIGARPPLRRLPITEAVTILRTGEASVPLSSNVKSLRIRYGARNSYEGTREFISRIAPQLAYANPAIPITLERITDPRNPSLKPGTSAAAVKSEGSAVPATEVTIDFHTRSAETRKHTSSAASRILAELLEVAESERPGIEGTSQPMIQGPSRTRSLDEGNGNAAGVTEDASAETESAVGAVAAEGVEGQPVEGEGTAMREAIGQPSHRNKLKHD